jgi:hypothetical protein
MTGVRGKMLGLEKNRLRLASEASDHPAAIRPRRRDLLRLAAAFIAEHILPRRGLGKSQVEYTKPLHHVIIVTFGGGCRYQDTLAPEGWPNVPHITQDLAPQSFFYPAAFNEGITGHFNSSSALITGAWQNVDSFGSEPPRTPTLFECLRKERKLPPEETWVIATNKSFSLIGASGERDFGAPYSANVILPKQLLLEAIHHAVSTRKGPGVEDRETFYKQMLSALDEGYENYGWRVHESEHKMDEALKRSLEKALLNYFNDPSLPSSGDELTFFMAKEVMARFAPALMLVNFWDIDIAHYGSYSLYLQAIERTDRLVWELWQTIQASAAFRDRTTLFVIPEVGRDGDIHGNGFANHRSGDEACRRVWLLATGEAAPKRAGAERPIRHIDIAPTAAAILGCKLVEAQGQPLQELAI